MQALGNTTVQAIEALRSAVRSHIKVYGSAGHEPRLHAMPVTPRPAAVSGAQQLREEALRVRKQRGFWSGSSWLGTEFLLNEAGLNVSAVRHRERAPLFAWADAILRHRGTQVHDANRCNTRDKFSLSEWHICQRQAAFQEKYSQYGVRAD
jgi:hypothetical protein